MAYGFTNAGGGGASTGPLKKGTIVVSYPAGATCTVSNGSKTYTALDTSGAAAFSVDAGTWTVRAYGADGDTSKSVSVVAGGWVSVELSFFTGLIYDSGKDYVGLEYVNVEGSGISMSEESDHILMTKLATGGQSAGFMCAAIDITEYSKITATYVPANTGTHPFYIAAHSSNSPSYSSGPAASTQMMQNSSATSSKTAELDISTLSGVYYVGIYGKGYGGVALTSKCLKIEMT